MSDLRRATGHLLVALYPEAWRKRYRTEILALIEDDPPRARGLVSLVLGAADAHLRPQPAWNATASPLARMRLSVGAVFCCWIALSVAGFGFQKETEEAAFAAAGHQHPVLAVAHGAVIVGAMLGAVMIALGGLPLVWEAVRGAHAERNSRLFVLLSLPAVAIACFGGLTWLLVAVAPSGDGHPSTVATLTILGPWWLAGLACATTCAISPRLVLRRAAVSPRSLRWASRASLPLALAMSLITIALASYAVSLALLAPRLSGQSGGALWPSTGATLAAGFVLAAISTALALISSSRGLRARARYEQ